MKFEFPAHNSKKLFKFQAQDSDLECLFWRFDKHIALSEKNLFTKDCSLEKETNLFLYLKSIPKV